MEMMICALCIHAYICMCVYMASSSVHVSGLPCANTVHGAACACQLNGLGPSGHALMDRKRCHAQIQSEIVIFELASQRNDVLRFMCACMHAYVHVFVHGMYSVCVSGLSCVNIV